MLQFRPIDVEKTKELCVRFRADAFVCSFGSANRFFEADSNGAERYIQWLKKHILDIPGSCVHVFESNKIIGQIEMGRWKKDASVGYVNLFYLIPEYRGQGLGAQLDEYADSFFQSLSCKSALLSVSPKNVGAMNFYAKYGWVDIGARVDVPDLHYLKKLYTSTALNNFELPIPSCALSYKEVTLQFCKAVLGQPSRELVPNFNFRILTADGSDVGHINFRIGRTQHVQLCAGHIGFEVAKPFRGHRYALQACLAIAPLVRCFYKAVIITCDPDNLASKKTIERLAVEFLDEVDVPTHDPHYQRGSRTKRRYQWTP